jgi:hypothetical protein
MPDDLPDIDFPKDVEFRMIVQHQQFITNEFTYYKALLRAHENELFWLSLGLVTVLCFNYYMIWRVHKVERMMERTKDA